MVNARWVLPLAAALAVGGCHHKKAQPLQALVPAKLPLDDIAAARAVGEAAVKEKDPNRLAGMLTTLLARVYVPIVNRSGSDLVTPGILTGPVPKEFWLWEPVVAGIARATALGDLRPTPMVLAAFASPRAKTIRVDLGALAEGLAAAGAKGVHSPLTILGTALDADLRARDQIRPSPMLDPAATLFLGVMLVDATSMPLAAAPATSAVPPLPGMPKLPNLPPNVQKLLQERQKLLQEQKQLLKQQGAVKDDISGALNTACAWMAGAHKASGKVQKWLGKAIKWGAKLKSASEDFRAFAKNMEPAFHDLDVASTIMDGLTGMGIAAFVDVQGDVRPTLVKYGDGPAKYRVLVQSALPVDKDQLDRVVNCLGAIDPTGTLSGLEDLPPHGPMPKVLVRWNGTGAYDPKHGKFTTAKGAPINLPSFGGAINLSHVAQELQQALNGHNAELTGLDGKARATFQVKRAKPHPTRWTMQRYVIEGVVFPFPIKPNVVMTVSNLLWNRSMPIGLTIKIPGGRWKMHLDTHAYVHPMGMSGKGFLQTFAGTVPFHVNQNDTIVGHGTVQSSFSLDQHILDVHCTAPAGTQPLDVDISGKLLDVKGDAELHLSITSRTGHQSMTFHCQWRSLPGVNRGAPNGRVIRNVTEGTQAAKFSMKLSDSNQKELSLDKSVGPVTLSGILHVRLETDDAEQ